MHKEDMEYTHPKVQINLLHKQNFTMPCAHFHSIYEMYYLISGSRKFFIKNKIYDILPGTLILIPPNVIHRTLETTGEEHSRFIIEINPDYIPYMDMKGLLDSTFKAGPVLKLPEKLQRAIEQKFDLFRNEVNCNHPYREDALKVLTVEFFIQLNRYAYSNNMLKDSDVNMNNKLSEIITYINDNYKKNISLTSIAEEFYISRHHLSRIFKKYTGFTVGEYITNHRINASQYLLVNTDMKIIDIASQVGFNSLSNFGRTFKRLSDNKTPKEYRNQLDQL